MKHQKKFLKIICIFLMICFSGCAQDEKIKDDYTKNTSAELSEKEMHTETVNSVDKSDISLWEDIGQKIKGLENVSDINENAIIVNNHYITKRDVEIQKIYANYLKDEDVREKICGLIETKVVASEADRLGVYPDEEKINAYIEQTKENLERKVTGTETIFALINGLNVTQDEYLSMLREEIYTIYQRDALREYLEQEYTNLDFLQYIENMISNAEIEFLDESIKEEYYFGKR